jgi:alpha-mannosidase
VSGGLADNRRDREGRAWIDVTTTVTLWAGLDRIDFEVEVDNTARDMRLRVIFPVPYSPARVATEAHFYVAERPPEAEAWNGRSAERPAATFPQKTFTALDGPGAGIAVFNRGLPEGEVIEQPGGSAYALTLLRAVGWLSRPDLDSREGGAGPTLRTFDSQVPGVHRFAYAWTAYTGAWKDAGVLEMAHAFAFPPRAWHLAGWAGDAHELPVAAVAGAVPSALHRSHLDGVPIVRVYRASGESGTATFTVPGAGTRVERTNLLERQAEAVQCGSKGTWDAYLKPWQIATFRMPG